MNLFDLNGKVAIVTGASRGIGRATAEHLALLGAKVCVSSRRLDACEEVAEGIRARGGQAFACQASISQPDELRAMVARVRERFGPIDILVCNAATNPYYGPLAEIADEMLMKIVRNNVLSNLWLANLVRPDMQARGSGSIVIVSSIAGLQGSSTIGAYGLSKAGDMQLARDLAVEWGPQGIRVNCIAPGLIETKMAGMLLADPEIQSFTHKKLPLRRVGQPHEIAGAIAFLASPAATFVTGQTLVADGGAVIV